MAEQEYYEGIGRRKTSTARVRIYPGGEGRFVVNDRPLEDYFSRGIDLVHLLEPLKVAGFDGRVNVSVHVEGGGVHGQAGAVRLGIARALLAIDPNLRAMLGKGGFLTRDARAKERKKPGLKRARKAPQYTKR